MERDFLARRGHSGTSRASWPVAAAYPTNPPNPRARRAANLDRVIMMHAAGEKTTAEASAAKLQCSELFQKHASACLQFFGGYGFMMEYPIARAYTDSRVQTIYAGTSEIMREIVSKNLGLAS